MIVRVVQATKRDHVRSVSVLENVEVVGSAAIEDLRLEGQRW